MEYDANFDQQIEVLKQFLKHHWQLNWLMDEKNEPKDICKFEYRDLTIS